MTFAMHLSASLYRSSFSFYHRLALKRDTLWHVVLTGVRVLYLYLSWKKVKQLMPSNLNSLAPVILGFRPRVQGLRNTHSSNASSFTVHRDHSHLCAPFHCNVRWASTSPANAFVWSLEHALSTSTISAGDQ